MIEDKPTLLDIIILLVSLYAAVSMCLFPILLIEVLSV